MWWGKEEVGTPEHRLPKQVNGHVCCGCAGHAMELRVDRWWCFTCNAWQTGCGR